MSENAVAAIAACTALSVVFLATAHCTYKESEAAEKTRQLEIQKGK